MTPAQERSLLKLRLNHLETHAERETKPNMDLSRADTPEKIRDLFRKKGPGNLDGWCETRKDGRMDRRFVRLVNRALGFTCFTWDETKMPRESAPEFVPEQPTAPMGFTPSQWELLDGFKLEEKPVSELTWRQPLTLAESFLFGPDNSPDQCCVCGRFLYPEEGDYLCGVCESTSPNERLQYIVDTITENEKHGYTHETFSPWEDEHHNLEAQGLPVEAQILSLRQFRKRQSCPECYGHRWKAPSQEALGMRSLNEVAWCEEYGEWLERDAPFPVVIPSEPCPCFFKSASDAIQATAAKFPSTFGLRAFPGKTFKINRRQSYMSHGASGEEWYPVLYVYVQMKDGSWAGFSKGRIAELWKEIRD